MFRISYYQLNYTNKAMRSLFSITENVNILVSLVSFPHRPVSAHELIHILDLCENIIKWYWNPHRNHVTFNIQLQCCHEYMVCRGNGLIIIVQGSDATKYTRYCTCDASDYSVKIMRDLNFLLSNFFILVIIPTILIRWSDSVITLHNYLLSCVIIFGSKCSWSIFYK